MAFRHGGRGGGGTACAPTAFATSEARRRLRGTEVSVEELTQQVGYADVTHFIRPFRRVHGQTPAQWRRASGSAADSA